MTSTPIFADPLTLLEHELLDNLIEEAAEIIQAATKMKRFGKRPKHEGIEYDNIKDLSCEVGNLEASMWYCERAGLVKGRFVIDGFRAKAKKQPLMMRNKIP